MTNYLLLDLRRSNRGISRERLEFMFANLDVEIARVKGLGAETGDEYLEVLKVEREAIVLELPSATSVPSQVAAHRSGKTCKHRYVGSCPFCLFASAGRARLMAGKGDS